MSGIASEVWLRGPVAGYAPGLQPVVHSLKQALEDADREVAAATAEEIWSAPGGATSAGFHLLHMANALDRLMTYARGEALSPEQRRTAAGETEAGPLPTEELILQVRNAIEAALEQLKTTPESLLDEPRGVGRQQLPSTVRGIVFHAAEHTTRHAGQAITTLRIVRGLGIEAARD
jgi:uncharacterized damage-inducible protein DinB